MHDLGRGELSNQWSGSVDSGFLHVRRQQGLWLRLANDINAGHDRDDREQKYDESSIHDFSLTPASWKIFTRENHASAGVYTETTLAQDQILTGSLLFVRESTNADSKCENAQLVVSLYALSCMSSTRERR